MRILVLGLLLFVTTSCVSAIFGKVITQDKKPIKANEAKVNISSLDSNNKYSEILNVEKDGSFRLETSIPDGKYLVEAVVSGYKTNSVSIELKESKEVELTVEPLPVVKPGAVKANTSLEQGRGQGGVSLTPPQL